MEQFRKESFKASNGRALTCFFTVGSDWVGKFDYLNNYCKVVYLDRTQGVSSSELRSEKRMERIGIVGSSNNAMSMMSKFERESHYANGIAISGICTRCDALPPNLSTLPCVTDEYQELLDVSDAIYLVSRPEKHYQHIMEALSQGKHVLVESPITVDSTQYKELTTYANERGLVLMDGIKTAYSIAYNRMMVLAKSGAIGDIISVDATCTSLPKSAVLQPDNDWNSITAWGPTALLPVLQLLGPDYEDISISSKMLDNTEHFDIFSKVDLRYPGAVASMRVAQGVKSEGQLVISGTKGYIYVPAPWWKTDYFELRYEDQSNNRRYFYQLEGEGIRNEIVAFLRAINGEISSITINDNVSKTTVRVIDDFYKHKLLLLH